MRIDAAPILIDAAPILIDAAPILIDGAPMRIDGAPMRMAASTARAGKWMPLDFERVTPFHSASRRIPTPITGVMLPSDPTCT